MPYKEAIEHYPKTMQIFIRKIHQRIESGRNALIVVIGPTGSGKSLSTLSILIGLYLYRHGKMPSIDYLIEQHCVFKAKDFLARMNDPDLKKKEDWIWDEAGVDIGHKDHMSVHNKVIGWLAQTFRNLQQVVFFTVPTMSFIDASVRKLIHYQLETRAINKKTKIATIKPLELQYNNRNDKIYYHNLSMQNPDGFYDEIDVMKVPIPPSDFVEVYEQRKSEFTTNLNIKIQAMLEERDREATTYMNPTYKKYCYLYHYVTKEQKQIARLLSVSQPNVSKVLKSMDKKYDGWRENATKYLRDNLINQYNQEFPSAQLSSQRLSSNKNDKPIERRLPI